MAYVALFDILGFRSFIQHTSLKTIRKKLQGIDNITAHSTLVDGFIPVEERGKPTIYLPAGKVRTSDAIRFSDTILMWTQDEGTASLHLFLLNAFALLESAFISGIPLRGAITRGELYVSKNRETYVGEGLVRAHDLEKSQDWAGAIIDSDRIKKSRLRRFTESKDYEGYVLDYAAPFKAGPIRKVPCLGWPLGCDFTEAQLRRRFLNFGKSDDWRVKTKIDHTVEFMHVHHDRFS